MSDPQSNPVWIIAWTTAKDGKRFAVDHWSAHDRWEDAVAAYAKLCDDDNVATASLCLPVLSTDYACATELVP